MSKLLQQELYDTILNNYERNTLPYVSIVEGPLNSGRLYMLLELAKNVVNNQELTSENVYFFTNRNLSLELNFAHNIYKEQQNQKSRDFLQYTLMRIVLATRAEVISSDENFSSLAFELYTEYNEKDTDKLINLLDKKKPYKIDDIRELQENLSKTSNDKTFIIVENLDKINTSVNNALLKTLEDLTDNTYLFILVNQSSSLLDTIKSRAPVYTAFNGDATSLLKDYFFEYNITDLETYMLVKSNLINLESIEEIVDRLLLNDIGIVELSEFFKSSLVVNTTFKKLVTKISTLDYIESSKLYDMINNLRIIKSEKELYYQNAVILSSRLIETLRKGL